MTDFINSKTFTDRNLTDKQFVEVIYKGLLSRNPDNLSNGSLWWETQLKNGMTRNQMLNEVFKGWEAKCVYQNDKILGRNQDKCR